MRNGRLGLRRRSFSTLAGQSNRECWNLSVLSCVEFDFGVCGFFAVYSAGMEGDVLLRGMGHTLLSFPRKSVTSLWRTNSKSRGDSCRIEVSKFLLSVWQSHI